jgi:hypothetical protein
MPARAGAGRETLEAMSGTGMAAQKTAESVSTPCSAARHAR